MQQYPDHPTALYLLGWSAELAGRNDEAIAAHERMITIDSRWNHALGRSHIAAGRTVDRLNMPRREGVSTTWN